MRFTSGSKTLDLSHKTAVVGVINVTPDSYYDGGKYADVSAAVSRAGICIKEGADIVEIGGESTGPGSEDVPAHEELARVLPVVRAIRSAFPSIWISVDTYKAQVAEPALAAGADMINDITAGRGDPAMFGAVALAQCPYVIMFSKNEGGRTTVEEKKYDDVISAIRDFLWSRKEEAINQGIAPERLIFDPGLGHFLSADPAVSFEVLARLKEFADLGPILVSPSRKSFLAGNPPVPPSERLPATLAAVRTAVLGGASFIRTHDVAETLAVVLQARARLLE